jgi:hypothetical protein
MDKCGLIPSLNGEPLYRFSPTTIWTAAGFHFGFGQSIMVLSHLLPLPPSSRSTKKYGHKTAYLTPRRDSTRSQQKIVFGFFFKERSHTTRLYADLEKYPQKSQTNRISASSHA